MNITLQKNTSLYMDFTLALGALKRASMRMRGWSKVVRNIITITRFMRSEQ